MKTKQKPQQARKKTKKKQVKFSDESKSKLKGKN